MIKTLSPRRIFLTLALMLMVVVPATPVLAATDPYGGINCSAASDSAVCQTRGKTADPITGSQGVLMKVINVIAFVAGIAAVLLIVIAGIKYITSQGDPQQISQAKQSIIYAAVGVVVIVVARQIISFILSKV